MTELRTSPRSIIQQDKRRIQKSCKGWLRGPHYLVAAVRSALFATAPEFKMRFFLSLSFHQQTENSPPLSDSVITLQNSPSVLYYWPHIPPSGWIKPDKVFLHPAVRRTRIPRKKNTHAHTLSVVWKFQGANLTRHTHLLTTRHMLTRCAHICMHCTARLSIALSFCLVLP